MNINIKGFENLIGKLERIANLDLDNKITNSVADKGVEIANSEYLVFTPSVKKEIISNNIKRIVSEAEGLSFEEYGTGTIGEQNRHPNLPQSGVPITGNWEYNYKSDYKKTDYLGNIYWTYKSKDGDFVNSSGQKSGQQMYNTSIRLQKEIPTIVKNIIKKELKDV